MLLSRFLDVSLSSSPNRSCKFSGLTVHGSYKSVLSDHSCEILFMSEVLRDATDLPAIPAPQNKLHSSYTKLIVMAPGFGVATVGTHAFEIAIHLNDKTT